MPLCLISMTILNQHLISGAGTYYLRVKGSAANDVQRYSVILSISDSTLPVLALTGPCADGTVGILAPGGIEAVFTINFQTGGASHRIDLPQSSGVILNMAAPTTLPSGAPFVIFGKFGVALPSDLTPLPLFIGDMCFNVPPLAPLDPTLFILADNITTGAALLPSSPAPWFTLLPPIPLSIQVTLQGIILENAIDLRTTNAILLNIL